MQEAAERRDSDLPQRPESTSAARYERGQRRRQARKEMQELRRLWWWEAYERVLGEIEVMHSQMSREVEVHRLAIRAWDVEREDRDSIWEAVLQERATEEEERQAYERRLEKAMEYIVHQSRMQRKHYLLRQSTEWVYPQDLDAYIQQKLDNPEKQLYDPTGQHIYRPMEALVIDINAIVAGAREADFNTYDVIHMKQGFDEYLEELYSRGFATETPGQQHGEFGRHRLNEFDEDDLVGVEDDDIPVEEIAVETSPEDAFDDVEGWEGVSTLSGSGAARDMEQLDFDDEDDQ